MAKEILASNDIAAGRNVSPWIATPLDDHGIFIEVTLIYRTAA